MSTLPSAPVLLVGFPPQQFLHHHQLPLLLPHNASHRNGKIHTDLVQALLADALGWSSEKWSKASGRATVGLDQVRPRLSMSIPTQLDYIRCIAQSHWKIPAFGYINNKDHRLVEPGQIFDERDTSDRAHVLLSGWRESPAATDCVRTMRTGTNLTICRANGSHYCWATSGRYGGGGPVNSFGGGRPP